MSLTRPLLPAAALLLALPAALALADTHSVPMMRVWAETEIAAPPATVTPSGTKSKVTWLEQYTDESAGKDAQATAARMQADLDAGLAALRKQAEAAAAAKH